MEIVLAVLALALAGGSGFLLGRARRAHRVPKHTHIWGNWETHKNIQVTFSGRSNLNYRTDVQDRECLGCGKVQREKLSLAP